MGRAGAQEGPWRLLQSRSEAKPRLTRFTWPRAAPHAPQREKIYLELLAQPRCLGPLFHLVTPVEHCSGRAKWPRTPLSRRTEERYTLEESHGNEPRFKDGGFVPRDRKLQGPVEAVLTMPAPNAGVTSGVYAAMTMERLLPFREEPALVWSSFLAVTSMSRFTEVPQ